MSYSVRKWRHSDKLWRDTRLIIFERDGHLCQIRGNGCTLDAEEVDHIIRPEDGGSRYEHDNLRAACKHCNASRGGRIGAAWTNAKWRRRVPASREW